MNRPVVLRSALSVVGTLAMLTACGGSPPQTALPQKALNVVRVGESRTPFHSPEKIVGGNLYITNDLYGEIVPYGYEVGNLRRESRARS